jgi:hypothetical protein
MKQQCIQSLYTQYSKNSAQAANISKLTSDARGDNKAVCMDEMG